MSGSEIWANRMCVILDGHIARDLGAIGTALALAVAPVVREALDCPVPRVAGDAEK